MSYKILSVFTIDSFDEIIYSFLPELENNDLYKEKENFKEFIINQFLNECVIDILLNSRIMVFAKENYIQVYKYNLSIDQKINKQNNANLISNVRLNLEKNDKITCISIIPIYFFKKNNDFLPDFVCIFVGFQTGYVQILTESLYKIFEFRFLELPVLKFDFQTFYSSVVVGRETEKENYPDEILIFYSSLIIRIDALKLVNLLKNNKINIFKDENDKKELLNQVFYEIWNFNKPDSVTDFIFKNNSFFSYYDNLVKDSITSNFTNTYCNTSKRFNSIITTGNNPYVGFYNLIIDKKNISFKSIISNFIFTSNANNDKFISNELTFISGLFDDKRIGKSIILSPNKNLALVCDQLERIILIDLETREMIRMWKNYPNCQCSFIEVNESKSIYKKAIFLCFYLPSSGYLEIWPAKFGDIVSKIHIGSNYKLIYKNYYMLGMQNDKDFLRSLQDKFNRNTILFNFNTFECFILEVSFLCSLGNFYITSKDTTLINEIPELINLSSFKKEDLDSVLLKITEPENKLFLIKLLIEKNDLDLVYHSISILKSVYALDSTEPFIVNCNILLKLLFVYKNLIEVNKNLEKIKITKNIIKDVPYNSKYESEILKWEESHFSRIISLFSYGETLFPEDIEFIYPELSLSNFLNNFKISLKNYKNEICLINFNSENIFSLSYFMFSYLILIEKNVDLLNTFLSNGFKPLDLIYLLFFCWSKNKFVFNWKTWNNLFFISNYLIIEYEKCLIDEELKFKAELIICLRKSYELLLNSNQINSAIVGAYTIQGISNTFLTKNKLKDNITEIDDEWETINLNKESFNLILKQLEDIYLLNLLLKLNSSEMDFHLSLVSLSKSKNYTITELVSRYFVQNLINVDLITKNLINPDENSDSISNLKCNFSSEIDFVFNHCCDIKDDKTFIQLFNYVRNRFPIDLNSDILLAYCAWFSIDNFMKNACLSKKYYLQFCLNYLTEIKDSILKHKSACFIWKCFIMKFFIQIKRLLKLGNFWDSNNYEYLCMDDSTLEFFTQFIYDLLSFILNSIDLALSSKPIKYQYEEFWTIKKFKKKSSEQKAILNLILSLPVAKHYVVLQHCHLALIIYFLANFKEKLNFKLEKIFPEAILHNLPNDLNIELDEQVGDYHKKFQIIVLQNFSSIVAKSVPSISTRFPNDLEQKSFMQANSWISKLIELAKYWDINVNFIKNKFIYTLYKNGCDKLANEVIYIINDEEFLGKMFIDLIVPRLYTLYGNQIYTKISLLPTELINEFNKKKIDKVDFDTNFECTKEFIKCILSKLSKNSTYIDILSSVLQLIENNW